MLPISNRNWVQCGIQYIEGISRSYIYNWPAKQFSWGIHYCPWRKCVLDFSVHLLPNRKTILHVNIYEKVFFSCFDVDINILSHLDCVTIWVTVRVITGDKHQVCLLIRNVSGPVSWGRIWQCRNRCNFHTRQEKCISCKHYML